MELKDKIFAVAYEMAARVGIAAVSRNAIADKAGCSTGAVSFHHGEMRKVHTAIVKKAIADENLPVLGWAIAERHHAVQGDKITDGLRKRALAVHLKR